MQKTLIFSVLVMVMLAAITSSVFADTASVAPADIIDLMAVSAGSTSIQFTWTAPGADGMSEPATGYDFRRATSLFNAGTWTSQTKLSGLPTPGQPGTSESFTVTGLSPNTTYYFAVRGVDSFGTLSPAFNIIEKTTTASGGGGLSNVTFTPRLEGASVVTQYFTITLYSPGTSQKAAEFLAQPDTAGKIMLPANVSVNAGTYDIAVVSQYHLRKKLNGYNLSSGASVILPVLPTGDLNLDNTINSLDWSIMSAVWFSTAGGKSDLNKDGIVNSIDSSFISKHWFESGN